MSTHTKDSLKALYGSFWGAYRNLKAQHPGFKITHPSWARVIEAYNNPPQTQQELLDRIARLEAQLLTTQADLEAMTYKYNKQQDDLQAAAEKEAQECEQIMAEVNAAAESTARHIAGLNACKALILEAIDHNCLTTKTQKEYIRNKYGYSLPGTF